MGKLYFLYLYSYTNTTIGDLRAEKAGKLAKGDYLISALALRDRQSGKLLTRTEFYAELKRMTAKSPKTDPNAVGNWSVFLVKDQIGGNKIGAIKALRDTIPGLGLREAKDMIEFVGSYARAKEVCERFNAVGTIPVMRERA